MNTILTRAGAQPATAAPQPAAPRRARRLLSRMLHVTLDRMSLPYRDIPPELFRFPPF